MRADGGGASLCILLEKCVGELWGLVEESRLTPALAAKLTLQAAAAVKVTSLTFALWLEISTPLHP
jgi:hypothetical protein